MGREGRRGGPSRKLTAPSRVGPRATTPQGNAADQNPIHPPPRKTAAPARSLSVGALHLDTDRRLVTVAETPVELTPTEFSLLQTLLESPGHVFSRSELMERALGSN